MNILKEKTKNNIQCIACARYCEIEKDRVGYCGVRQNIDGKICLLNYGRFLFLKKEGNKMLVGGLGSNMRISFDPNWDTALYPFLKSKEVGRERTNREIKNLGYKYEPQELVKYAKSQNCEEIVFQFNEPLVYLEYVLDVCKLKDIKVSIVTTGYFSNESLNDILSLVDEVSFLFFSTFDKFYIKHCSAQLSVIKKNIKLVFKSNVEVKILVPVIPNENDIFSICKFLKDISPSISLYFYKFMPSFRMLDKQITKKRELKQAVEIAEKVGLKNVDFIE